MAAIVAEHCQCVAAVVTPMTVLAPLAFIRQDHPALEREVTFCSIPC
jgi:hypothetical protein